MKKEKIFIVDPVGIKAGMDYYSMKLGEGLSNQYFVKVFSNYSQKISERLIVNHCFYSGLNLLFKIANWFTMHLLIGIQARFVSCKRVIFHGFSYELKDLYAILCFKILGIPVTLILHDISNFAKTDQPWIKKRILKLANDLVVHNRYSYDELMALNLVGGNKVHVIKHGHFLELPDGQISQSIARKRLGIGQDEKVILFFGQIKKVKGLDVLIDAFDHCRGNYRLIIAGKTWNDDFSFYSNRIQALHQSDKVTVFNRYITNDEREYFYKAADLIVLPYREIYQSGVLLMAMSYGLPVLTSDLPANREIVDDELNGLLFKCEDIVDLARKIELFFDRYYQKNILEKNAIALMKNQFSWDIIAEKHIKTIE